MKFETFINKFPIKFNEQQKEAIQAVDGPVLLLAVPGSGKTTVLVTRLGYMIQCCGIQPSQILVLTYTVAATQDMRERFIKFFGTELGQKVEFRTINSICIGAINEYGRRIGKKPFPLENDEKVLLGIIATLYRKYEDEYPTESDLKSAKTLITYIKNMMLSDDEIKNLEKEAGYHIYNIYQDYCKELKKRNCMDFDDQMKYAYTLFKTKPEILAYYQNMFPYICVDEAQDTSKIQHEIIALLASKTENLFMVGDEDQSIYGFRAAYPEALLSFEQNHPGANILLMEENFRSNANIVTAADEFIQKNKLRHKKSMKATRQIGTDIREILLKSREAQYSYLLKVAQDCNVQTAILYRDNESVIPLVDLLERKSIPYKIRNAELSFFTHRTVIDIQNIIQFAYDMGNTELFEQIYYKLSSYLNKQTAMKAVEISREHNISIFTALLEHINLEPYKRKNLKVLETHFNNMVHDTPEFAIRRIMQFMGYGDYLKRACISENKIFILKTIAKRECNIEEFLNRIRELKDIIENKKNDNNSLFILSTIHGSKGLEYDNVYMMDVQNGVFPDSVPCNPDHPDDDEIGRYEEERRLFYVGITRAKNNLFLFKTGEQSIFIEQLLNKKHDAKNIKMPTENIPNKTITTSYAMSKIIFNEMEYSAFVRALAIGQRITHARWGEGVITALDETTVKILFGNVEKPFNIRALFLSNLVR